MSAQQAWAQQLEGEARQESIISSMAAHSADLYRQTMEQLCATE